MIHRAGRQTQVEGGVVIAIDASGGGASYVGAMRLEPFLRRYAVDGFVVLLAVLWQAWLWSDGASIAIGAAALLGTLPLLLRRRFPFGAPVLVFAGLAGMSLADPEDWRRLRRLDAVLGLVARARLLVRGRTGEERAGDRGNGDRACERRRCRSEPRGGVRRDRAQTPTSASSASSSLPGDSRRPHSPSDSERRARSSSRSKPTGSSGSASNERVAAAAAERARIADDLHDVIAHSVSVMTVQAGAARLLLGEDPQRAREPLLAVEETGRQALADMRRLLGLLRADEDSATAVAEPRATALERGPRPLARL